MAKLFRQKVPAAAFDRLLDRVDPHHQLSRAELWQAQRLCGHWLARQRLRRGLTIERIVERTGVDMQSLFLLEAGLTNEAQAKPAYWKPLIDLLADEASDSDLVRAALSIAVGQSHERTEQTLARIRAELSAEVQSPAAEDKAVAYMSIQLASKQETPDPDKVLHRQLPTQSVLKQETRDSPEILYQQCSDVVDSLMARYGWHLLDRTEFARTLAERVAAGEFANPNQAAIAHYSNCLYIACFGHEGAERQEIGFIELHNYLYTLSFRVVADLPAETRDDMVNETVARIWQRLASYRNSGAFLAVAAMELRNVLPHWKRAQSQYSVDEVAEQLGAPERHDSIASSLNNDLRRQVQACFTEAYDQHPRAKKQIDAVRLTYLGYDDAAISAQLDTPVKNVYVLRSRGLDLLSKQARWQQLAMDIGLLPSPMPIGGDRVCQ